MKLSGVTLALAAALAPLSGHAFPSTFGPVIGSALLCRSHLDNAYFYSYMESAFGPAYKHEGGAYWFRTEAALWGVPVTDVLVSDDTSALVFVGAITEGGPDKLASAIRSAVGTRFDPVDASAFALRVSNAGSTLAYFNSKSKIYCAKYKPLPPGP